MRHRVLSTLVTACAFGAGTIVCVGADTPKGDPALTGAGLTQAEAKHRLGVVNDLLTFALGLQNYEENNQGLLPPADGAGAASPFVSLDGAPREKLYIGLSWRAMALVGPQPIGKVDQKKLDEIQQAFNSLSESKDRASKVGAKAIEPWNIPVFKEVALLPYSCPIPGKTKAAWDTFYRTFVGKGAAFEAGKQLKWQDFTDGRSNTILVVEAGESVPWPKPDELQYDAAKPLPKLGGLFPDGFYAAFADGKVRFIKRGTDEKLIRAMITRNGGEQIPNLPPLVNSQALRTAAGYKD
jgi:hypothetical protein